jgi:hypothetical protein
VKSCFQGKKSQLKVIISTGVKQRPESEAAPFWFSARTQDLFVQREANVQTRLNCYGIALVIRSWVFKAGQLEDM